MTSTGCLASCDCLQAPRLFTEHIQCALDQVKGETNWKAEIGDFNAGIFWTKQDSILNLLQKEVNKLSVSYSSKPFPKCKDAEKLFDGGTKCVLTLVSSIYHLPLQQGQMLFERWHRFYEVLLTTLLRYSTTLLNSDTQSIAQSTGAIWELCSAVNNMPKDNKSSLVEKQKQVLELVNDALFELEEAKKTCSSESSEESSSQYDHSILIAGIGLVKTAKILLHKSLKSIQLNGHSETAQQVTDADTLGDVIDKTSETVDDFAVSLYSPVSVVEVRRTFKPLANHLSSLLAVFRESHFCTEQDVQWTTLLENAISHNDNKVSALVT